MSDKKEGPSPPSKENLARAFAGTAVFSDRAYVTLTPLGFRFTFMESVPGEDDENFRAAVFMPLPDAISFKHILDKHLENVKVSIEQKEKKD